ncbi:S1/P1 nuclease [Frateuria aurantia]
MPKLTSAVALGLALTLTAPMAMAWGPEGHSIVAALAQQQLNPAAEAEVIRLLAPEHTRELADIASWPDQIQDDPALTDLWHQTRQLHYIDFGSGDCHYVPERDCKDGQCVVAGLQHYVEVLSNRSLPDAERLQALKFVVHFVGDEHQPLHDSYRDDKGGNTFQVQFDGRGSNLHRVWDSGMLWSQHLSWQAYAAKLAAEGPVTLPPETKGTDPYADWAEESCRISRDQGVYPSGHVIDQHYVDAELPIAEAQLRIAGKRLADVLDASLGTASGKP